LLASFQGGKHASLDKTVRVGRLWLTAGGWFADV
jgi:hypothetical protein